MPESIIQSEQYTFVVGKEKVPVVVHAAALAATSTQIDRLINGGMKEAKDKCAEIPDISVEDFTRFCEYAYRGDYAIPSYAFDENRSANEKVEGSSDPTTSTEKDPETSAQTEDDFFFPLEPDAPAIQDGWSSFGNKKSKKPKPSKTSNFRESFRDRNYLSRNECLVETTSRFEVKSNTSDEQDYTPIFLAHARLYAFAHMRLAHNLRRLTLEKLHKTLVGFQLFEARVNDIIGVTRYAYSNEYIPDRAPDECIDELRKLIVDYIVSEFDVIGKAAGLHAYLEEGGQFASDLLRTLSRELL